MLNGSFHQSCDFKRREIDFGTEIIVTKILLIHRGKQKNQLSFLPTSRGRGWLVCLFLYICLCIYASMCLCVCWVVRMRRVSATLSLSAALDSATCAQHSYLQHGPSSCLRNSFFTATVPLHHLGRISFAHSSPPIAAGYRLRPPSSGQVWHLMVQWGACFPSTLFIYSFICSSSVRSVFETIS